jgi:transposase-like protein
VICCPRCNSENIKKNGFQIYNGYQKYKCKDCLKEFNENTIYKDSELIKENVRLAKKEQTQRDLNRIERKSFREYARIENAIEEYNKKLIEVIQDKSFNISTIKHKSNINSVSLLVQLSDLHLYF